MSKIFEPWNWQVDESKVVDLVVLVSCPPCANCVFWNPMRLITYTPKGDPISAGVRLCWAPDQEFDFSCYTPKES